MGGAFSVFSQKMKSTNNIHLNIAYSFQAVIILFWWIGIDQSEQFYKYFQFSGISKPVFYIFLIPDIIAIAIPSVILIYRNITSLKYIVLGSFIYASIFCITATLTSGGGEISTILMLLGTMLNFLLCYKISLFRTSSNNSNFLNLLKTAIQICLVWSLFLIIIPYFILKIESKIPLQFQYNIQSLLSLLFFVFFSMIGLWSGYTLSYMGKGTPLPVDSTKKLVVAGPYSYVRNPMAICGIGQGLSIALLSNSISILIYCIIGAFAWNYVVRKIEEEELALKFGQEYESYRQAVLCWIPKLKKYKSRP